MTGYQPLPKTCNDAVNANIDDVDDKDEYEYVIEKGCFPKHRKVLSNVCFAHPICGHPYEIDLYFSK